MKKHVFIASIVVGLSLAPVAAFAADSAGTSAGASTEMKGPPNANGAQEQGRSDSAGASAGASTTTGDTNGAAAAKATGSSGDAK